MSSSITFHFRDKGSKNLELSRLDWLPTSFRDPASLFSVLGLQAHAAVLIFMCVLGHPTQVLVRTQKHVMDGAISLV